MESFFGGLGLVILASLMIIVVNLFEVMKWTIFFFLKGVQSNHSTAFYNALLNYTTLQAGYLTSHWRLLEPPLGTAGLLTVAWSTGILYMLAQDFQETQLRKRRHEEQGKTAQRPDGGTAGVIIDAWLTRGMRSAVALTAMIFATAAAPTPADTAVPSPGAKSARAEIQLGLCAPTDRIVQALALRPTATPLKVWQFDDAALTLFGRGLRLRLRVDADGRSEFTLKVADQDCARLERGLVPSGGGKCEYDVHGTSMAGAVSLTRRLNVASTKELIAGRVAPAQVMSPAQIRYLREVVRIWPLPTGIHALGPTLLKMYRTPDKRYDIDITQLPDGAEFAEISRKVPAADATRVKAIMEADLSRAGVEICADQTSQAVNKLRSLVR